MTKLTFEEELAAELTKCGLPATPARIIGRTYQFGARFGSHHEILVGTVQGIRVSDQGILDLYVSTPYFAGLPLVSIKATGDKEWGAYVPSDEQRLYIGDFKMLEFF